MATMETSFFILFLTDVARLPLAMVAVITGFSGIADAVTAVLAGAIIDKTTFKNGKYRLWLIYCPPVVVIFFILMFTKDRNEFIGGYYMQYRLYCESRRMEYRMDCEPCDDRKSF